MREMGAPPKATHWLTVESELEPGSSDVDAVRLAVVTPYCVSANMLGLSTQVTVRGWACHLLHRGEDQPPPETAADQPSSRSGTSTWIRGITGETWHSSPPHPPAQDCHRQRTVPPHLYTPTLTTPAPHSHPESLRGRCDLTEAAAEPSHSIACRSWSENQAQHGRSALGWGGARELNLSSPSTPFPGSWPQSTR